MRNLISDQIYVYTYGSRLEGTAGAEVTACHKGKTVLEETYQVGKAMEVFNTEMSAIEKETGLAEKYTTRHRDIRHVWIFSDNQEAVHRIRTSWAGPGQYMVLSTRRCILPFQGSNVKVTVQWVPQHVEVPRNENTG